MYQPSHFVESRPDVMHALMRAHPFATLVVMTANGLDANHIPLLIYPQENRLRGHIARANAMWRERDPAVEALAIFQGPQHYITPGWYPSKAEHHKVVPTWNYAVVHARGTLSVIDDAAWLINHVSEMTAHNEASRKAPWKVSDAPADFIAQTAKAIVGIEIALTSLTGKWKVSQNRPAEDQAGVVAGLKTVGTDEALAMARLVEGNRD